MNGKAKNKERLITLSDIDSIVEGLPKEDADNAKRQLRKSLLKAYDSHKSTVIYEGREESAEQKAGILAWKQSALDLKTEAFQEENVPNAVKYYL